MQQLAKLSETWQSPSRLSARIPIISLIQTLLLDHDRAPASRERMAKMRVQPELAPVVNDEAPTSPDITLYDEEHFVTCLHLLETKVDGANWEEVALIVLHRDPSRDTTRSRRCWKATWRAPAG